MLYLNCLFLYYTRKEYLKTWMVHSLKHRGEREAAMIYENWQKPACQTRNVLLRVARATTRINLGWGAMGQAEGKWATSSVIAGLVLIPSLIRNISHLSLCCLHIPIFFFLDCRQSTPLDERLKMIWQDDMVKHQVSLDFIFYYTVTDSENLVIVPARFHDDVSPFTYHKAPPPLFPW